MCGSNVSISDYHFDLEKSVRFNKTVGITGHVCPRFTSKHTAVNRAYVLYFWRYGS